MPDVAMRPVGSAISLDGVWFGLVEDDSVLEWMRIESGRGTERDGATLRGGLVCEHWLDIGGTAQLLMPCLPR
jgi:hypothetical protein